MNKEKKKAIETITIRPTSEYRGISVKLNRMAKKEGRSLNNYLLRLFKTHIENDKMVNGDVSA